MSLTEAPDYAAIHQRLRNPVNGRASSELDIVAAPVARRRRFEAMARADTARRNARIAELEMQIRTAQAELRKLRVEAFPGQFTDVDAPPTLMQILVIVSDFYFVPVIHILSRRKTLSVVLPRHVTMFLAKELTFLSLAEIGRRMGDRDHTTVMSAVQRMTIRVSKDAELAAQILEIKQIIEAKRTGTCNVVAPAEIKEIISA